MKWICNEYWLLNPPDDIVLLNLYDECSSAFWHYDVLWKGTNIPPTHTHTSPQTIDAFFEFSLWLKVLDLITKCSSSGQLDPVPTSLWKHLPSVTPLMLVFTNRVSHSNVFCLRNVAGSSSSLHSAQHRFHQDLCNSILSGIFAKLNFFSYCYYY